MPDPIYRRKDAIEIAELWKRGNSCALVGIGSSGKSRLVQSFLKKNIRRDPAIFGEDWQRYLPVYVDGNGLLEDTTWGLYEEMLDSAISAVSGLLLDREDSWDHPRAHEVLTELQKYHDKIISLDKRLAYRWISRAVSMLFLMGEFERVIFMLDDADRLLEASSLDPLLFRHLKSLRDHNKYRLCYAIATRRTMYTLTGERINEIDGFYKLVKRNTLPIGIQDREDSALMLTNLMERNKYRLANPVQWKLIGYAGQHPGLLTAAYSALRENAEIIERQAHVRLAPSDDPAAVWSPTEERRLEEALRKILMEDPVVREECYSIWEGLSETERVALGRAAALDKPVSPDTPGVAQLVSKSLLSLANGQGRIFSPIFAKLVPGLASGQF